MIYGLKILYWDSLLYYTTYCWICVYFALLLHRWQSDILQQDAEEKKDIWWTRFSLVCVGSIFPLLKGSIFFLFFSVCGRRVIFLQPSKYMYVYSTVAPIFLLPFYPSTFFKGFFWGGLGIWTKLFFFLTQSPAVWVLKKRKPEIFETLFFFK